MSLSDIQKKLKAPKSQHNSFGGYNYRSCEDVLEAVKPLLGDCTLTITDDVVMVGDRHYIKAIATFTDGDRVTTVSAYAREQDAKKGMDSMQLTGATSSYARKYALNGLFLIDDNKDADPEGRKEKSGKKQKASTNPDTIDSAERIKLVEVARKAGYANEIVKQLIAACGYEKAADLPRSEYETIIEAIEATPVEQASSLIDQFTKWRKEK